MDWRENTKADKWIDGQTKEQIARQKCEQTDIQEANGRNDRRMFAFTFVQSADKKIILYKNSPSKGYDASLH